MKLCCILGIPYQRRGHEDVWFFLIKRPDQSMLWEEVGQSSGVSVWCRVVQESFAWLKVRLDFCCNVIVLKGRGYSFVRVANLNG